MAETTRTEYEPTARESLLDAVLDKLQKSGKTAIVSRLIYVGRFVRREPNADFHKGFYNRLVDKYYQDGEVTGMLLCFPTCMVHLLEAKTSIINSILRDITTAGPGEHRLAEARVISSTEDIPTRCYSSWYATFINSASNVDHMDPVDQTTIVKAASELNTFMRKVGASLTGQSESELKRRLAALDAYHEDMPAPEMVLSLVPAEDAPTLEEYLDIYDSPLNIDLDSEQVWPLPAPLKI